MLTFSRQQTWTLVVAVICGFISISFAVESCSARQFNEEETAEVTEIEAIRSGAEYRAGRKNSLTARMGLSVFKLPPIAVHRQPDATLSRLERSRLNGIGGYLLI